METYGLDPAVKVGVVIIKRGGARVCKVVYQRVGIWVWAMRLDLPGFNYFI